ncbi:hypothetical protein BKN38_03635 [Helicobacter sp. CLO-3]|uniref:hypothetical protein n=1 Tax=unclassified Helicobacter TaxID=2593540 RepID=UPI0008056040|nr:MULTISPECIES: hypothetical protein [unclassified Helicobacter]OBV28876.1 hypothetical protein BA723_07785 [Helicobacter sp. CLO-3]OHU84130.1 hypothetical protein BKN38_03635 [Helicobacter sp. CLO-3]
MESAQNLLEICAKSGFCVMDFCARKAESSLDSRTNGFLDSDKVDSRRAKSAHKKDLAPESSPRQKLQSPHKPTPNAHQK